MNPHDAGADGAPPRLGLLIAAMFVAVAAGTPLVFYIWSWINDLLEGHPRPAAGLIALVLLVVLLFYLYWLSVLVRRLDARGRGADT